MIEQFEEYNKNANERIELIREQRDITKMQTEIFKAQNDGLTNIIIKAKAKMNDLRAKNAKLSLTTHTMSSKREIYMNQQIETLLKMADKNSANYAKLIDNHDKLIEALETTLDNFCDHTHFRGEGEVREKLYKILKEAKGE